MKKNTKIEAKIAMIRAEMNQRDVAKTIGVTDGFITQFLNGQKKSKRVSNWFYKNLGVKI